MLGLPAASTPWSRTRYEALTNVDAAHSMRLPLLALLVAAAFGLGSCDAPENSADKAITIGALYDLTGSQAGLDIPSANGARLAVAQANARGGVLGRQLHLVVRNGESDPDVVKARTAELLERYPRMSALMGLSDTDMVLAAATVAASDKRLFVTSAATSPLLPQEVPTYLYLACFGDNVQAAAAAEWAYHDLGARTVSVLFNDTMSYTRLLHTYFQARFAQLGGVVRDIKSYTSDSLAEAVKALEPADVIYVAAGPSDAPMVSVQLRSLGISTPILGGDGFDVDDVWRKHADISGVYFTTHAYLGANNPDPRVVAFRNAYLAAYPDSIPDAFAALGYDTANLLIAVIKDVQSADPQELVKGLGEIKDFQGVTGTLSYPPGSRIPTKSVTILGIESGRRVLVRQLTPTKVPQP